MAHTHNGKVGFISLGCAKNLVNNETMLGCLAREGFALTGESGNFTAAAWIPNTRLLWLSDSQGTVRILDVGSLISQPKWQSRRIEVSTFQAHHTRINDLAITPGGGHVATAADDGSVRVWRVD